MQVGLYLLVIGSLEGLKIRHDANSTLILNRLEQRPRRPLHVLVVPVNSAPAR